MRKFNMAANASHGNGGIKREYHHKVKAVGLDQEWQT